MLRHTPVRRIGTLSTVLANSALYLAHWTGIQTPAAALILSGCFFRCLTLPYTIYGDQCLRRAASALPELQDAYKDYCNIADHPDAIVWEKRVAAQKLKNDRERIFRSYRTNNVKMIAPHAAGAATSLYCLGVPAQQIGTFFLQDAGMPIVSPLSVSYVASAASSGAAGHLAWTSSLATAATTSTTTVSAAAASSSASSPAMLTASTVLVTVDPTLALAAGLTCVNVYLHLQQRTGFNDRLDGWIGHVRRAALGSCAVVAIGSLLSGHLAYALAVPALQFFPPYLAPVWLGMSITTVLKSLLVNRTAPGCALFHLPPYPPQHGTYGGESTAAGHEYRLAFTSVDVEEARHVWLQQKRILDFECDIRIHRTLTRLGFFNDLDELAYESERLQKKRVVARERRLARESDAAPEEDERDASHDGDTQAARRRRAMRQKNSRSARLNRDDGDGSESVSASEQAAAGAQADRIQEEENKRRRNLKLEREAAWKRTHEQSGQ